MIINTSPGRRVEVTASFEIVTEWIFVLEAFKSIQLKVTKDLSELKSLGWLRVWKRTEELPVQSELLTAAKMKSTRPEQFLEAISKRY